MTIVLRHNQQHELSRIDYSGALTGLELDAQAQFNADNAALLGFDCVSVVHADIDVSGVSMKDLEQIFHGYQELFRPSEFLIMRRSAWVCEAAAAVPLLQHWLNLRDPAHEAWSDVRLFATYDEVAEWLLLGANAREAMKTLEGFSELARFESLALTVAD